MISIEKVQDIKKKLSKSKTYIKSKVIKEKISNFFENEWIPNSEEILEEEGNLIYGNINKLATKLYSLSRRDYFLKKEALKIIRLLEKEINKIKLNQLKRGIPFKEDFKKEIIEKLNKKRIKESIKYLKIAEKNIKKDAETSCVNSRKAIEEVFRIIRSKYERREITRGTLGQHSTWLYKNKKISSTEKQFFNSGVYGFLSEKGNHANKEKKEEADALFGFKLVLISIDYLINKRLL